MVYSRTVLTTVDNSGATYVKTLTVTGGVQRQYGRLYDTVLVVPKKIKRRSKGGRTLVQKRRKYLALIMTSATNTRRRDGGFVKFLTTTCAVFGLNGKLVGNSIKAPMCREIKLVRSDVDVKRLTSLSRLYV